MKTGKAELRWLAKAKTAGNEIRELSLLLAAMMQDEEPSAQAVDDTERELIKLIAYKGKCYVEADKCYTRTQIKDRKALIKGLNNNIAVGTKTLSLYDLESSMLRRGSRIKRTVSREEAESMNQSTGWNMALKH